MSKRTFGEIMKHERIIRNISRKELASKLKVTTNYVALLECGKRGRNITEGMLVDIAFLFDLRTDYLLGLEDLQERNEENDDYKELLSLYKLMEEKTRKQLLAMAHLLLT